MSKFILSEAVARIEADASDRALEATKWYAESLNGSPKEQLNARFRLMQGITTSDIPELLTPALNIQFLAEYDALPTVWRQYATEYLANDFGTIEWGEFTIDDSSIPSKGGKPHVPGTLPHVGELDSYPAISFAVSRLNATLSKGGERARLSWEALRKTGNFDLLQRFTSAFALHAAQTEDREAASQLVTSTGLNTANFKAANNNVLAGATDLNLAGLEKALDAVRNQKVNGNFVNVSRWTLIVPPALAARASALKSITSIRVTDENGEYDRNVSEITGVVDVLVNPWIPTIAGTNADKLWFLIPQGNRRENILNVFLNGERQPLITVKDSGHFTLGGGQVPIRQGSFDEDDVQTRVRHVVSGAFVSPAGTLVATAS